MPSVGSSIPRLDGVDKVTGRARYVDDITLPGMWHGAVVRSVVPHGRVAGVEFDPAFDWGRVVVADAKDIPGRNCVAMIEQDVPLIVTDVIKHVGEAILLIAAPTRELAYGACRHVKVSYEEWQPVLTIDEAKEAKIQIRGPDNIISQYAINKGDIEAGFKDAHKVVEGTYYMGHQEHMYIETNGMIAGPRESGGFEIVGSMQCPYYILKAMTILMALPEGAISVRQAVVGGAFGGKEDYPSILAGYCLVLAKKTGRPVKIIYDRVEDTEVTTKRHPARVSHRTGVKRDGTITAMDILMEMDGGAYATMTPVVLSRGLIHSAGAYRCGNVRARGVAYATNTVHSGAFRGFGVPQAFFPLEVHIDRVAAAIGIPPHEFRRRNCLRVGDTTATGQMLKESVATEKVIDEAVGRSGFEKKFKECRRRKAGHIRRGIGMALFMHGAGFTGSGETMIAGKAGLRLDPDGKITVLTACTELGQGAHTVLPQIVADCLGVDVSCVGIETPDTSLVPNSGPTVASRTTMIIGDVLCRCAKQLKEELKGHPKGVGPITVIDQYSLPPDIVWDQKTHTGAAYPAYAWGCDVAEVEVDMDTFEVRVVKMWLAQDVGRAINPKLTEGQIEGGTVQSLGYALMERHLADGGRFKTNRLQTYIIPTFRDVPEMETVIIEEPYSYGPMGAKGLGELPMDGGAPAIANAIANATGICVSVLPITPEKIYEAWKKKR